jgi:hypothetical protein
MAYDIRPLSFGEILDRAFRVYKDKFALFVSIAACILIPYGVLLALCAATWPKLALVPSLIFLLIVPVMHGAMTVAVADVYLDKPITFAEAYAVIRSILKPFMATYLILGVILAVPMIAAITVAFLFAPRGALIAGVIGLALFYFIATFSLILPIMAIDRLFGFKAVKRSFNLVWGSWWKTFGILTVGGLIVGLPTGALNLIWMHIPVLGQILNAATEAVAAPYSAIAIVAYYIDRRCRLENFDLHLLAWKGKLDTDANAPLAAGQSPIA